MELGILSWTELTGKDISPSYFYFFEPFKSRIALMRNIEFVVKYHEADVDIPGADTDPKKVVMGVFKTLQGKIVPRYSGDEIKIELEEVYRAAENQTHGEWYYQNVRELGNWCSTYIKQTPWKINETLKCVYPDIRGVINQDSGGLDAENMILLGQFLNGIQGGGKPIEKPGSQGYSGKGGGGGTPKPTLDYIRNESIQRNDFEIVSYHVFKVNNPDTHKTVRLYPVCPDEDGGMKLRGSDSVILPIALSNLKVLGNDELKVQKYVSENGNITLRSDMEEYTVSICIRAVTDCKYAVNIESLETI